MSTPQEGQAQSNAGAPLGPGGVPFDPAMIEKFKENCFVRGGFAAVMGNYSKNIINEIFGKIKSRKYIWS